MTSLLRIRRRSECQSLFPTQGRNSGVSLRVFFTSWQRSRGTIKIFGWRGNFKYRKSACVINVRLLILPWLWRMNERDAASNIVCPIDRHDMQAVRQSVYLSTWLWVERKSQQNWQKMKRQIIGHRRFVKYSGPKKRTLMTLIRCPLFGPPCIHTSSDPYIYLYSGPTIIFDKNGIVQS